MPASLTIPTVFTAVDRFSAVVKNMGKSLKNFGKNTGSNFLRFNQRFNQFFKLDDAKKQLLSFASTAAVVSGLVSGLVFSARSMIDYEKNIASLHMILDDVSNKDFAKFQKQVDKVAKDLQYSAVDVASSFAKIAELNYSLAETPESLAAVSKASITLSRAASVDLTQATEGLVGILSQFNMKGQEAARVNNVLAAGLKYGSANIQDQIESYKNWGAVAKAANIDIERATALTQVLAKYQLKGSEAGTALRGVTIKLQKAHMGYASGIFNINDALLETNKHYNKLAKARDKDNYLIKMFGIRQINAARILLTNIDYFHQLTQQVTGTNEASLQAAIATDTVAGAWQRVTAQFVNYVTSSEKGRQGMKRVKDALRYVADNMDSLIDSTITAVKWFAGLWAGIQLISAALKIFNLYNAASTAISTAATAAIATQTVTVTGFGSALSGVTTELTVARTAAAGLVSQLALIVLPAALTALTGKSVFDAVKWNNDFNDWHKAQKTLDTLPDTSKEKKAWDNFQSKWYGSGTNSGDADPRVFLKKWYLMQHPETVKAPKFIPNITLPQGKSDNLTPLPVLNNRNIASEKDIKNGTPGRLDIFLHDPNGNVKDVRHSGSGKVNVTVTPTWGRR